MRKLFFLGVCFTMFWSCSDGDLQIEAIDFDEGSIQFCSGQEDIETTLFFKINTSEALILDLQSNLIKNEPSQSPITSSIGSQSSLTYRFFSGEVASSYFCSEIPPASPTVIEEINATDGVVQIISTLDTVTRSTKTYNHVFTITEVVLTNGSNESIIDQTGIDFGDYETSVESSVGLIFTNFEDISINSCGVSNDQIVLSKVLKDEFLSLTMPVSLLENVETGDTPREMDLSETIVFRNGISSSILSSETVCAGIDTSELKNEFSTTEGKISVTTTASEPDENSIVTYTHTISLTNFVLQDMNGSSAGTFEEAYVFGTFTTTSE